MLQFRLSLGASTNSLFRNLLRTTDLPLYVSDLDGTLLRNDTSLSQYSKDTLNALLDQGLLFTVASARSIASMRHVLADLPLRLPVVEFNGAFVSDLASGQHYLVHDLHRDILSELWQQIADAGYIPFISTYDGTADRLYYRDITNDGMAWYLRNRQLCSPRSTPVLFSRLAKRPRRPSGLSHRYRPGAGAGEIG